MLSLTLARGDGDVSPTATTSDGFAPSDSSYYYHSDHQGSVRALSDENGNVINEYAYDSYGNPDISVEGVPQVFGYTGRFLDAETGLYYYRARHYDASTARFLQEDPIWFAAGDLNVHRYVWNNPVNWNDPSGLSAISYARHAAISAGALTAARLTAQHLLSRIAVKYGLNAAGRQYFSKIAGSNIARLAAGKGSLGDVLALQFAGIAAVLHQANEEADDPAGPGAGASDGAGANAAAGGGNNDGEDPKCKSLRRKMDRRLREFNRREAELRENYNNLPQFGPGPNAATQQGHRRIINKVWNDFRRADKEFIQKCL